MSTLELACALPAGHVDQPIFLMIKAVYNPVHQYLSVVPVCLNFSFLFRTTLENINVSTHFANVFLIIHLIKSKPNEIIIINHPFDCSVGCQQNGLCWPGDCN